MKTVRANLNYFVESGIHTRASEDGELVDISYMAKEALEALNGQELETAMKVFDMIVTTIRSSPAHPGNPHDWDFVAKRIENMKNVFPSLFNSVIGGK